MRKIALVAIKIYQQVLSPYWPSHCRYDPTCSNYTYQAISKHGMLKGFGLGFKRIGRCRPRGSMGYDPVP
ncbi:MAG: membrane protein insertion efficiency factor YidD [Chloroflexota bacterium]|nr:membrane protein insertion efficiency factor YidD [Chloroflexota bacterium]